jgi:HEAT repeat protein
MRWNTPPTYPLAARPGFGRASRWAAGGLLLCRLLAFPGQAEGQPKEAGPLAQQLESADRLARWEAAKALGELGVGARDAIPALAARLADPEVAVRHAALWALVKIGPDSIPALSQALRAPAAQARMLRRPVALELGRLGGIEPLAEALAHDEQGIVRQAAAEALGKLGPPAKSAVPALIGALEKDPWPAVRRFAAESLGWLGPDAKEAVPALAQAAQDPKEDMGVRPAASWAAARINSTR